MPSKINTKEGWELHPRNKNRERYDLKAMAISTPGLSDYIEPNKSGEDSINFSDPDAVKMLNTAILHYYYGIKCWEFPKENLCPPIPGRADYIHYIADLLSKDNKGKIPIGKSITCLDIGLGASCIYPIIGITEYKWNFIGSDINSNSLQSAEKIVNSNPVLQGKVICKLQKQPRFLFQGIIEKDDLIDVSISNPPFHSSDEEALKGAQRKIKNLTGRKTKSPKLNFSGINKELVYAGGESQFIQTMILESKQFSKNCLWFSTLVSKESNLKRIYKSLKKMNVSELRTINMRAGNKKSRIVAWTYFSPKERKTWLARKA